MIIVNLKTYEQAYGEKALNIAKACKKVADETGLRIVICPQAVDIRLLLESGAEVFAQHIDTVPLGKFTGWISPEIMINAGITGTLINHSEHRIPMDEIKSRIDKCKELGIMSVVCAESVDEGLKIKELEPDVISIEPPELIGSDISVSTGKPELIEDSVKALKTDKIKVLVGAGVRTTEDVKVAKKYNADGILSASEISKSSNPEESLRIFARGFE